MLDAAAEEGQQKQTRKNWKPLTINEKFKLVSIISMFAFAYLNMNERKTDKKQFILKKTSKA